MLQIYDDQHRRIAGIDDPDDLKIEKTLSSGDKQISFSYPKTGSEIENLRAEYYIRTKDDEYVLKEINTGENKNSYVAQLNIEELESQEFLYGFESVTQTARACLEFAFDGTGWTVGICTVTALMKRAMLGMYFRRLWTHTDANARSTASRRE
jgi:hypothetical protein